MEREKEGGRVRERRRDSCGRAESLRTLAPQISVARDVWARTPSVPHSFSQSVRMPDYIKYFII